MLLAYRETPSFYAVGRMIGVTHQTVERSVRRAERLGVMAALDDSPVLAASPSSPRKRGHLSSTWLAAKPRTRIMDDAAACGVVTAHSRPADVYARVGIARIDLDVLELAAEQRRFGYRRLHILLRAEGCGATIKMRIARQSG